MPLPYPAANATFAAPTGLATCAHCGQLKSAHVWTCGCCSKPLVGDPPLLHAYKDHPFMRHSNAAFHLCPVAFRAAPPAAGAANGNGANGTGPKASYGPLPKPPPVSDEPLTVDEAWRLFGIPQKRGRKEDVKKRYLEFIQKHHPDKHPKNQKKANEQCSRANQAWALLQKHCKW